MPVLGQTPTEGNFNDTAPAPPSGQTNLKWQVSESYPDPNSPEMILRDVSAYLPLMTGDSGTGGTAGAVPAPATGDAAAGKFLKADGTWAITPAAGGGFSPGGDLAGTATAQTVIGLEGKPLDAATVGTPADGQVITFDAPSGKYKAKAASGGSGGGTVTSVALSAPPEFTVSGSPVTGSGTLALAKANEPANQVWAGPPSGASAAPAFRALVATDIPAIPESGVTGLTADLASKAPTSRLINTSAPLTGGGDLSADRTLAINTMTGDTGSGGTRGVAPAPAAGDAAAGKFLKADATWAVPPGGTGGGVPTTRLINTTAPLTGGGDLSADRTLAIDLELGAFRSPILTANVTAPTDTVAVMPGGLVELVSGVVLDLSASTGLTCMEIL